MENENKEKFENDGGFISDIKEGATENREDMMLQEHDPEVDPATLIEEKDIKDEDVDKLSKNTKKKIDYLQNFSDVDIAKTRNEMADSIQKHDGKWWNDTTKGLTSAGVEMVPWAGPAKQVIESIRGQEYITGKKLDKKERAWKAVEGTVFFALDCYTCGLGGDVAKGSTKLITRSAAWLRKLGAPRSVSKTVFKTGKFIAKNPKLVLLADKALDAVSTSRKSGKLKDKLTETVNETLIKKAEIDLKKESDPNFKIETEKFEKHEKNVNENYEKEEKNKKKAMINEVIKGE